MTKFRNLLWGLVIVIAGLLIGLDALDIVNVNIFFDGWWTLFIIVPCVIGLFSKEGKLGNIIGIIIGMLLLLGAQNIISFDLLWKLAVPIILVLVGLYIIFKDFTNKKINKKIDELKKKARENTESKFGSNTAANEYTAVFSGQNLNFDGEFFKGATLNASFGGIKCDLRGAFIDEDTLIKCDAIFGGIDIYPPRDVKVKVKSSSIFGGVTNKAISDANDNAPTLYIDATCVFGGVDIK